ncbi:MAG: hypothetical protein RL026_1594 [Pseudomonadota bacterium]
MRILHVILSRGFAGSERYVAELAAQQQREGHEVHVVVARDHRDGGGRSIVDALPASVARSEIPRWWRSSARLASLVAAFQPEVVHAHLRKAARRVATLRVRHGLRVPCVATLHIRYNHPVYLQMDALLCSAAWQAAEIPATYRGTVFTLPMLLAPHPRLDEGRRAALRAGWGAGPTDLLVGVVGRLTREKGTHVAIEGFRRARLPGARLMILGDGREARRLRALLTPDMSLPGFRRDVRDCQAAFDVLVCPTLRMESGPLVILESLDAGTPVIASDLGGCGELLRQHGGDLFPPGDADALAAALARHHAGARQRHQPDLSVHRIDAVSARLGMIYRQLQDRDAAH